MNVYTENQHFTCTLTGASRQVRLNFASYLFQATKNLPISNIRLYHNADDTETMLVLADSMPNLEETRPYYSQMPIHYTPEISSQDYNDLSKQQRHGLSWNKARKIITEFIRTNSPKDIRIDLSGLHTQDELACNRLLNNADYLENSPESLFKLAKLLARNLGHLSHRYCPGAIFMPSIADGTVRILMITGEAQDMTKWLAHNVNISHAKDIDPRTAMYLPAKNNGIASTIFDVTAGRSRGRAMCIYQDSFARLVAAIKRAFKDGCLYIPNTTPVLHKQNLASIPEEASQLVIGRRRQHQKSPNP